MKKIILSFIMSIIFFVANTTSYAEINVVQFTYPWNSEEANIPLDKLFNNCYLFDCNGEKWIYSELTNTNPIRYNKDEADFFIKQIHGLYYCHDYLWTGEYYMARLHRVDNIPQSQAGYTEFPVRLYDKSYNMIKEYKFDKYVKEINFINGRYYCRVGNEWLSSEDFEKWQHSENIIACKTDNINYVNNRISFNNSEFIDVKYENNLIHNIYRTIGEYIFANRNGEQLISVDNIYFITVPMTSNNLSGIYFKNDNLIYEGASRYFGADKKNRIYVSKHDVDKALDEIKKAPYVKYNNTILAFEVPPVIQDDYTLIPARFLFEQMGAEVGWNQDTQTATITQDNTAISLAIDDNIATVNGEPVTMDVPARLINGKTMVPVRFLSEELGYNVEWDGENRIITIE